MVSAIVSIMVKTSSSGMYSSNSAHTIFYVGQRKSQDHGMGREGDNKKNYHRLTITDGLVLPAVCNKHVSQLQWARLSTLEVWMGREAAVNVL